MDYRAQFYRRLPIKTKLFLVPSLNEDYDLKASQAQVRLMETLDVESLNRFFPSVNGPALKGQISFSDHSMANGYQPYLHNQLLESINPERMRARQAQRLRFEQQMQHYAPQLVEEERVRNRLFLNLQNQIGISLRVTQESEFGVDALRRFDSVADEGSCFEKFYG